MRTTCGTILAVALAALSAHGAFGKKDPMATKALMQLAFSLRPLRSLRLKHQSRLGSFSVDWGDTFYTIYMFYTDRICVGPRSGCFRAVATAKGRVWVG